jgi:hypothetical protein
MNIDIDTDDRVITIADAREHFNGCIPGWQMFAEAHGFVWVDVVRHGLKASQLLNTEDAMAIGLVEFVYNREVL